MKRDPRCGKASIKSAWLAMAFSLMLAGTASAQYVVISVPLADPGDTCIPTGVASGEETQSADGSLVLATRVHGTNSSRCPNPLFPNVATAEKIKPVAERSAPSRQCVSYSAHVGDEVAIPGYGRALVQQLHASDTVKCRVGVEATVVSAASQQPSAGVALEKMHEPSEVEIQMEYDRIRAALAPVREYHVRHILLRTREEALAALRRIHGGKSFTSVASAVSTDPASRAQGGDMGWKERAAFPEVFARAVVSLEPAGLAPEPVQTKWGWHVIELMETKIGKDSFPTLADVRTRIIARLKDPQTPSSRVVARAVCRKRVDPQVPASIVQSAGKASVDVEMRVEDGRVTDIISMTGPSVFHAAVKDAVRNYGCDKLDRPVIATQTFQF